MATIIGSVAVSRRAPPMLLSGFFSSAGSKVLRALTAVRSISMGGVVGGMVWRMERSPEGRLRSLWRRVRSWSSSEAVGNCPYHRR